MDPVNLKFKQEIIEIAQSAKAPALIEVLNFNRIKPMSVIGKDEFSTLVSAITLQVEADFINRLSVFLENVREGILHETK